MTPRTPLQQQLVTMMMLGHAVRVNEALHRALLETEKAEPSEWVTGGIDTSMWSFRIGETLADHVPTYLAEHPDVRPAVAVARLIADAVRLGIEVGARVDKDVFR